MCRQNTRIGLSILCLCRAFFSCSDVASFFYPPYECTSCSTCFRPQANKKKARETTFPQPRSLLLSVLIFIRSPQTTNKQTTTTKRFHSKLALSSAAPPTLGNKHLGVAVEARRSSIQKRCCNVIGNVANASWRWRCQDVRCCFPGWWLCVVFVTCRCFSPRKTDTRQNK